MSANVLDMIVNDAANSGGIWWENGKQGGKDGTSRIALAKRIKGTESVDEILDLLGWRDWRVEVNQLVNPITGKPVDAYEIVRTDKDLSYGIKVTETKPALPPEPKQIVEFMARLREATDGKWVTAGETTTAKIWTKVNLGRSIDMGDGDLVEGGFLAMYDYRKLIGRCKTAITNPLCENTLTLACSEPGQKDITFSSFSEKEISDLVRRVETMNRQFDNTVQIYKDLQTRPVDMSNSSEICTFAYLMDNSALLKQILEADEQQEMVADLIKSHNVRRTQKMGSIGKEILANIVSGIGQNLDARKDNWYGAYQGLTYVTDNVAGRSEGSRIDSAYFGVKAELKEMGLQAAQLVSSVARSL